MRKSYLRHRGCDRPNLQDLESSTVHIIDNESPVQFLFTTTGSLNTCPGFGKTYFRLPPPKRSNKDAFARQLFLVAAARVALVVSSSEDQGITVSSTRKYRRKLHNTKGKSFTPFYLHTAPMLT
ncbi:hypothetical protein SCLCIDRAFT_182203 [Scleroderma citrinum Foug A]|uniref:Uncharacterized protein n=1 Tax=Scleroderma citrinum Foug A TaxID=1036808 RepID=A0A0C3E3E1_9AGAM|nr:hypothetical protein SCLCIDRAFT_182203 [Scleroderma citrinum Foug A]